MYWVHLPQICKSCTISNRVNVFSVTSSLQIFLAKYLVFPEKVMTIVTKIISTNFQKVHLLEYQSRLAKIDIQPHCLLGYN